MYDTLLFLHILAAFFLGAGVVIYSSFVLGSPVNGPTRIVAEALWGIGGLGTLGLDLAGALSRRVRVLGRLDHRRDRPLARRHRTGQPVSAAFQPRGDDSAIAVDGRIAMMHWLRPFSWSPCSS